MTYETPLAVLLTVIGFLLVVFAQIKINTTYSKYRKVQNSAGLTGQDVARKILDSNGLSQISVYEISGNLSDHYNPSKKLINLSKDIYNGTSIASLAVAAHECGHAIQDKENYIFFKIRSALVPVVNFVSYLGYFGLLISINTSTVSAEVFSPGLKLSYNFFTASSSPKDSSLSKLF